MLNLFYKLNQLRSVSPALWALFYEISEILHLSPVQKHDNIKETKMKYQIIYFIETYHINIYCYTFTCFYQKVIWSSARLHL